MLCSNVGKLFDNLAPLMSFLQDKIQNDEILANSPLTPLDRLVEVIEPVLPALFSRLEVLTFCLKEYKS